MDEGFRNITEEIAFSNQNADDLKSENAGKLILTNKGGVISSNNKMKEDYHKQRLWQSKIAFGLCLGGSIIGFIVIIISVGVGIYLKNNQWPGIISGITVEAISVLFYTLSNKANEKISEFFRELTKDSNVEKSIKLSNEIKDEKTKDLLKVKLALHLVGVKQENCAEVQECSD